jgi:serine/threonine protein phosphatase PrpC
MTARRNSDPSHAPQKVLALRSVARSHAGCVRKLNEDRFIERVDVGLWAIADGMGGHQAGEVAAAMVVEALAEPRAFRSGHSALSAVQESMQRVNAKLVNCAKGLPDGGIIGSTVVILLVQEGHYACLWAGDSRAYRYRDRRLEQLTRDHSVVQQMVDEGRLHPDRARHHPRANVVTRAAGAADRIDLETSFGTLLPGDTFLLCSDGLSNALTEAAIVRDLAAPSLEDAADGLMRSALQEGARDNVTLILIRAVSD